jgi:hypothetical protein
MDAKLTRISVALLVLGLLLPVVATAEDTFRWTDDEGNVHYGRTIPPEYANRPYVIINSAGFVIETVDDPMANQTAETVVDQKKTGNELEPLFTTEEIRKSTDENLLLRYRNESDLVSAMENEVSQLGYDARLISQSQASAMTSMAGQVKNAADRQRSGMPDDPEVIKTINSLRQRMRRSENELTKLKTREEKIRATFDRDLIRYRYLANGGLPGSKDPSGDS